MLIRWDAVNVYKQHLESVSLDKLLLEVHEDLNQPQTRLLKVLKSTLSVDAFGNGILCVYVDTSKQEAISR